MRNVLLSVAFALLTPICACGQFGKQVEQIEKLESLGKALEEGKLTLDEYSESLHGIAKQAGKAGDAQFAQKLCFQIIDSTKASPRIRAAAWWTVGESLTPKDVNAPPESFQAVAEAYDSAVQCLEEIAKEDRTESDFEQEGNMRGWLAVSCDIIGEKDRALAERLEIIADEDLVENCNPQVIIGVYEKLARMQQEAGLLEDAESLRADGLRYLLKRLDSSDAQLQLAATESFVLNSKSIPEDLRLKFLEKIWANKKLTKNPNILRVGNYLQLHYFFATRQEIRQRLLPFLVSMQARSEAILKILESKSTDANSKLLAGPSRIYLLQAKVIELAELERIGSKKKADTERRKKLAEECVSLGRKGISVLVPRDHPVADLDQLVLLVKKYCVDPASNP